MKTTFLALALVVLCGLVYGQLILDEDNPHDRKILDMIVTKINEAEHKSYKFKAVVYTLGDGPKFTIYLTVTDTDGVTSITLPRLPLIVCSHSPTWHARSPWCVTLPTTTAQAQCIVTFTKLMFALLNSRRCATRLSLFDETCTLGWLQSLMHWWPQVVD